MTGPRIPEDIRRKVKELKDSGLTWAELSVRMQREHPEEFGHLDLVQVRTRCRNALANERLCGLAGAETAGNGKEGPESPGNGKQRPAPAGNGRKPQPTGEASADKLLQLLGRGGSIQDISGQMGVSPRVAEAMIQDIREKGYNLQEKQGVHSLSKILPPTDNWVVKPWGGEKTVRFGLVSDTHIGGVDTQLTLLHHLYDKFELEGITDVYHAGDLTDGEKMRPGHEYEIYMHGADAQAEHAVKVYPSRPGITTAFITGNHDYSFMKSIGLDIGKQVAARRSDMEYLGYMNATIQLSPGCTLELRHPLGGGAYALSYKIQKMIEAMAGGEKPSILAVGHYHKRGYFEYRSIHALLVPTTQGQTTFLRGLGSSAHLGGAIIELKLRDDGVISEFTPRFIPFYAAVKEDYRQWL